jgi:hypothetical protein
MYQMHVPSKIYIEQIQAAQKLHLSGGCSRRVGVRYLTGGAGEYARQDRGFWGEKQAVDSTTSPGFSMMCGRERDDVAGENVDWLENRRRQLGQR